MNASEDRIEKKEEKITERLEKIEKEEIRILSEEGKVLRTVKSIEEEELLHEKKSLRGFGKFRKFFIKEASKHKFLFSMTVAFGVVLIWRGLWDLSERIPFISDSMIALVVGMGLLWFIERYSNLG
jgi:hypothetical protein